MNLLFPGQGSQFPGMGRFLYDEFAPAKQAFEEASDALSLDVKKLCFDSSESDLALTHNTQPAILTVSIVLQRTLQSLFHWNPKFVAGHSIGEYAALVTAKSLEFAPALRSVRQRGLFMQEAVPVGQGGMLACMGLENFKAAQDFCLLALAEFYKRPEVNKATAFTLEPANDNCPGQIVLSGSKAVCDWLSENIKTHSGFDKMTKKPKLIALNVSAPFHCSLMLKAQQNMDRVLNEITWHKAQTPVVQNYTATPETEITTLRKNLIQQISGAVLWTQTQNFLISQHSTLWVECGAGKVLQGLFKKTVGAVNDTRQAFGDAPPAHDDIKLNTQSENYFAQFKMDLRFNPTTYNKAEAAQTNQVDFFNVNSIEELKILESYINARHQR